MTLFFSLVNMTRTLSNYHICNVFSPWYKNKRMEWCFFRNLLNLLLCFVWWIHKVYWNSSLIVLIKMMIAKLIRKILGILLLIPILKIRNIHFLSISIIKLINSNLNKYKQSLISNNLDPILIDYIFLSILLINYNKLLEKTFLEFKRGLIFIQKLRKSNIKLRTIRKNKQG